MIANMTLGSESTPFDTEIDLAATTTGASVNLPAHPSRGGASTKAIENAVFAHIQAIRSLGKTFVNTADIARALGISELQVRMTLAQLSKKGVKIAQ